MTLGMGLGAGQTSWDAEMNHNVNYCHDKVCISLLDVMTKRLMGRRIY